LGGRFRVAVRQPDGTLRKSHPAWMWLAGRPARSPQPNPIPCRCLSQIVRAVASSCQPWHSRCPKCLILMGGRPSIPEVSGNWTRLGRIHVSC
jgi:hypothetical protein